MSIQNTTATRPSTDITTQTTQTCIPSDALVRDTLRVIENNRKLAGFIYRSEPFFDAHIQTALSKRFGWDVTKSQVRAAINELDEKTVQRCARPHPTR